MVPTRTQIAAFVAFSSIYSAAEPPPLRRRVPNRLGSILVVDNFWSTRLYTSHSINLCEISVQTATSGVLWTIAHSARPLASFVDGPGHSRPLIWPFMAAQTYCQHP